MGTPREQRAPTDGLGLHRRLSRRAFLRSAAMVGVSSLGLAAVGSVSASRRPQAFQSIKLAQALEGPIADLAAALAYDLDAIFRFVADDIGYEPYAGVLRGASGTLDARAGNSADQAVLLAALLDESLIPYRYVTGAIDQSVAQRLEASAQADEASISAAKFEALAGVLPGVPSAEPLAVTPEVQEHIDAATTAEEQVTSWARKEIDDTVSSIIEALRETAVELPVGFTALPPREVDQHIWIQALLGTDWVDLDPSMQGGEAGIATASARETIDELPEDIYHWVDFAVIGESASDAGISTERLLNLTTRADRVAGLPITFVNANPSGVERLGEVITPVAGSLSYVPTLAIGGEAFAGTAISFGRGEDLGEGLLGGADDLLDGPRSSSETSAEWLELTITSPDREPVVISRPIFDRFGPAARASGALDISQLREVETIEPEPGGGSEILPALATTWLAVNVGLPSPRAEVVTQDLEDTGGPAVIAQAQHVMRELTELAVGLPLGSRSFVDTPNVVGYTVVPSEGREGEPTLDLGLDIWHRSRGVLPVGGTSSTVPPTTLAGVLDHVAERVLSGDPLAATGDPADVPAASVGAVFEAAHRTDVPLVVLSSPAAVESLDYDADVASTLGASLAEGWLAVAPQRPVELPSGERAGWWLIEPASGRVIDQLDDGRGADEYAVTLTPGQLARETARQKLARDCLVASALQFAAFVTTICGIVAWDKGHAGTAMACGMGAGAATVASNAPLQRCLLAAFPG